MNKQIKRISLLVSAALLLGAESVLAAVPVTLPLNSTKYMTAPKITRIAVGNPEIADINLLSNHDFHHPDSRQDSVSGSAVFVENNMAGLLPSDAVSAFLHFG